MSKHKTAGGLGFRNFRDFNLAMLGKQGLRFITNTESLVSKIYKAKFFAGGDFLTSSLGHNPSFIWRSIHATKQLLLEGVKWRIGNRESIYISGQPWLHDDTNPFITTKSPTIENQKVSSMFCLDEKAWDVEIIEDIFNDRDQMQILAIQSNEASHEDVMYWSLENFGNYSVKSAYKFLQVQKGVWSVQHNSVQQRAEYITLCWAIWRARNDLVWNQKFSSINKIVAAAAKQYLTQWTIAQSRSSSTLLQPQSNGDGVTSWAKPQPNTVKVSVDAAIFEDRSEADFGMVARDSDGRLIEAKVLTESKCTSPVLAEAIAVKEALSWIDQTKWLSVTLESDCLVVVQAIRSVTPMRSHFGVIISECRSFMQRLNNVQLLFVKRFANMVAHQLAK
ncbi:uncharacterized protein LOC141711268 [Apium graveolens]|uniref:uncharacterized protein LOC141711268 n=1 Tax=Apium graveolens TaxID=4045 RepID=UPI003D7B323F